MNIIIGANTLKCLVIFFTLIGFAALFVIPQTFAESVIDSVVIETPDHDLQIAFKVTSPDDCHGTQDDSNWVWVDGECVLEDPPSDYKIVPRKYLFAAPLKQIKAGVALVDIQCNDEKHVIYKHDRMRAACVTDYAENQLLIRGWSALRLGMPATDDLGRDLCGWYEGKWDALPRYCHGLKYPLLCAMAGGDEMDGSCFIPSTTGVAPVSLTEQFKDVPEVVLFYARYDNVEDYVQFDRVNYASGNESDSRARLSLYLDANNELTHMRFYCFADGKLKIEIAQEDILSFLENHHCDSFKISPTELTVKVTGEQQVRRGVTHTINVDISRNNTPVEEAWVVIRIENYGEDIIRKFDGYTDSDGHFEFSWEIPKSFDDIETLLAYVDVTDDISAKTILFKFQVYCLPGEQGCKVEGN